MHRERTDSLKENNKIAIRRYQFAIKCLRTKKRKIIEYGSGLGYGCHLLRQAGHFVMGVDKSKKAFDYARKEYPGIYYVADIEDSEFEGYDAAICLEVLCHLKEPQKFIEKIKTKELIISAPIDPDPDDGYIYRLHNLNKKQFLDMFSGWRIIKQYNQTKYLTLYLKKI